MFRTMRNLICGGILATTAFFGSTALVQAHQPVAYTSHQPCCTYKLVKCYETRQVPYAKTITKYDHCGRPYCCEVTCFKTVVVCVTKRVPVCY